MKNTLKKQFFLIVCFISTISFAQIREWEYNRKNKSISIEQWSVNDVVFKSKKTFKNPYEIELFANIISDNKTQKIPLFFNGNKEWVLRYSSSKTGLFNYQIIGNKTCFTGNKGTFTVTENSKNNRHGGIVLKKEDPKHFYYEDSSHYFNLAFECDWLFALDYNKKELKKTNHLLDLIEENGFNQIVMNVYSHDVSWKKDSLLKSHPEHEYGGRQDIFPFMGSNEKPDYSSLNPAFFNHLDKVIYQMHDREIVSHLMIYVWNKLVSWPDMNTLEDNRYFDYVVKRYQAFPNIIWDVSKEALYYGRATEEYISERITRIRKIDSFDRLVSVHDFGFCTKHADEVDFISTQDWASTLYTKMQNAKNKFKNKPIFNIEHGGYEESPYNVFPGNYTNAETCLRRNYLCLFSGAYTTYYWQGASWNVVIHNPYEQSKDFYKPKFEYFKHLRKLFTDLNFQDFEPQSWKNSSGYNLTNKKTGTSLMYVPKENYAIKLWFLSKENKSSATMQWFNTLTGKYTEAIDFEKGKAEVSPWRDKADAILIVRKK
ncbi:apiosidase-like domain-containing protein [Polaribacter sp. SA4-12]|uniref:apiosidase-like domain-containing protein n=1 Tax=Polaribacter sp. SA4-12 TaxID=1312072 RepID=UPI000B3CC9BD|nr:DUF4038 domain-containing protein [Polaribacter sp. SA4-12]ARV16519.1 hypothetical protein BTO07_15845 [Polaribacter sp. SA4-12]